MISELPKYDIVLLGVGHTNAHVARMWKMSPIHRTRLTCVSNFPTASYSGMLPGVFADQYPRGRMEIDLVRFCASVGAQLVVDHVIGIDRDRQSLIFKDRPPLRYDALSIGIGSVPQPLSKVDATQLMAIKPMQTFPERFDARVHELAASVAQDEPLRIAIVGGGFGGVEVAFCMPTRLQRLIPGRSFELSLITRSPGVPSGAIESTQQRTKKLLAARGIALIEGETVEGVYDDHIHFDKRAPVSNHLTIWATGASPPPLIRQLTDLPKDERGFLATNDYLQLTNGDPIFAVGDSGTQAGHKHPKAGVYAVRQGMVLWPNLRNILRNRPLKKYEPQSGFLKLINTGDGKALLEYKGRSIHGRFPAWLKNQIDSRFMDKYQDYEPMEMKLEPPSDPEAAMRCAGCGGKVAGTVLSRVIRRLDIPTSDNVLIGLEQPDDAAVIKPSGEHPITLTVDFFSAPLDDPFLAGRLGALNAASDLFAMGTRPDVALAMSTIPVGPPRQQERLLEGLLAGSLYELKKMGATLIGGHTTEGPQIMIGFTMVAAQSAGSKPKSALHIGDQLLLTKPLGTGALLAAHMRARCEADWMTVMLASMLNSNQRPAEVAIAHNVQAITDVTGFGFAGHLLEMLNASNVSCAIDLDDVPTLPGAEEMVQKGVESTLVPHNRDAERQMHVDELIRNNPKFNLLFDPQTSGGLLVAVPDADHERILAALRGVAPDTTRVGEVTGEANGDETSLLTIR